MEYILNLDQAKEYISKLEKENELLRKRIEELENQPLAGRRRHDDSWVRSYNDFVVEYENGKTIMEIVSLGKISRRTAYRYKKYYDELKCSDSDKIALKNQY